MVSVPRVYYSQAELLWDFSLHQGDWKNPMVHRLLVGKSLTELDWHAVRARGEQHREDYH